MWNCETYSEDAVCIKIVKQIWKRNFSNITGIHITKFLYTFRFYFNTTKKNMPLNKFLDIMEKIHIHI